MDRGAWRAIVHRQTFIAARFTTVKGGNNPKVHNRGKDQ